MKSQTNKDEYFVQVDHIHILHMKRHFHNADKTKETMNNTNNQIKNYREHDCQK